MSKTTNRVLVVVTVVVGLFVLYGIFDPTTSIIAPKCIFKTLTGYDCPSCGGQRALHAILNGEIGRAFMLNPFLFVAIPFLGVIAYSSFSDSKFAKRLKPIVQGSTAIAFYLFIYIAWWVIRNTSLWSY